MLPRALLVALVATATLCGAFQVRQGSVHARLPMQRFHRSVRALRSENEPNQPPEVTPPPEAEPFGVMSPQSPVPQEMKISAQKTYASLADVDVASLNEEEREQYENALRIQELRAQEKFITTATGKMTCVNCGWTYDSTSGDGKKVPPGVSFEDLEEKWRCPVCYSPKSGFRLEMRTIAGFETNQSYGLGTNSLTEDQKNLLIFGGLFLGFLFLMSGYLLD